MEDVSSTINALIQRATNPSNPMTDTAAVVELCRVLEREPNCAHIATRNMASRIQSPQEWEALQALNLLDTCMKQCGVSFHAEVGKFRFLNEMIKLVSPKYLGGHTPIPVRQRVLELMHAWTVDYPREAKIREAYDMLKKQGVIKEEPQYTGTGKTDPVPAPPPPRPKSTIFEDEEKSRLLQKLLQSKNPEDLQAANRLIKTMVKEDERRVEMNSRRVTELESVHNNARLLSEMLDSYRPGQTSSEELELIKELHQSCERLRPSVFRLAAEAQDNDEVLNEVLSASDELGQVFDKFTSIFVQGKISAPPQLGPSPESLLDLSTPSEERLPSLPVTLLGDQLSKLDVDKATSAKQSDFEVLGDIFGSITPQQPAAVSTPPSSILQPVPLQQSNSKDSPSAVEAPEKNSKLKALEDLDALGASLLKQNLPSTCKMGAQFSKPMKVPMNLLSKSPLLGDISSDKTSSLNSTGQVASLDLDFLVGGAVDGRRDGLPDLLNGDDSMVDLSDDAQEASVISAVAVTKDTSAEVTVKSDTSLTPSPAKVLEVKPLTDVFVALESIKPGTTPPLTVLDEKNGISVILHFGKERPRPDVSVIVVTTLSKNSSPITNYLFQAVVPKTCKMRLQPPSGSELPAHNPFLPPSAITQIMLISNPNKDPVSLKFMVSYTMEDETCTEMGEVERLPIST